MWRSRVFVVEVWLAQGAGSPFRAKVRAVEEPDPVTCTSVAALARFLVRRPIDEPIAGSPVGHRAPAAPTVAPPPAPSPSPGEPS